MQISKNFNLDLYSWNFISVH